MARFTLNWKDRMVNRLSSYVNYFAQNFTSSLLAVVATYFDYKKFSRKLSNATIDCSVDQLERAYLHSLDTYGVCVVEGFWDENKCANARAEVDRIISQFPNALHSSAKADQRVFGANNVSSLIGDFAQHPGLEKVATAYNREITRTAFTLAARMPAILGNQGSGEGWHRDAFLRQFKAILYLSDVGPNNGPFQFLKNSHQSFQILRDIWNGNLHYKQYRLSVSDVYCIAKDYPERIVTLTAKAGTLILIDTSSIHRGMPIVSGTRYALTNYYYPEHEIDAAMFDKFNVLEATDD